MLDNHFKKGKIEDHCGTYDGLFFSVDDRLLPPFNDADEECVRIFREVLKKADFGGVVDSYDQSQIRSYCLFHPATHAMCFLKVNYVAYHDYMASLVLQRNEQHAVPLDRPIDALVEEILLFLEKPSTKEGAKEVSRQRVINFTSAKPIRAPSIAGIDFIQ
jgi:hypothetical protein